MSNVECFPQDLLDDWSFDNVELHPDTITPEDVLAILFRVYHGMSFENAYFDVTQYSKGDY